MKRFILSTFLAGTAMLATMQAGEVARRSDNQQDRIANGVKSGQLTAGETSRLEHREAHINRQISRDRAANGGRLTAHERRQVNREQNRTSRSIYRDKHNGRVQ